MAAGERNTSTCVDSMQLTSIHLLPLELAASADFFAVLASVAADEAETSGSK